MPDPLRERLLALFALPVPNNELNDGRLQRSFAAHRFKSGLVRHPRQTDRLPALMRHF
jgi:hypothetical protein